MKLQDIMNKLSVEEGAILEINNHQGYFSEKELRYITGLNDQLIRQTGFMIGINRCLKSNFEKYNKILAERGFFTNKKKMMDMKAGVH